MEKINIFAGIFDSWVFILVMVVTVCFQIIMVELLGAFAETVPLNWKLWLASVVIGAVSLPVAVVLKWIPVETISQSVKDNCNHDGYEPLPRGPDIA